MNVTGNRLREAMEDRDVDQSTLARAVGVTQGAISLILRGKTRQSKYLVDLAIYLGVNYDWLTGRSEQKIPMYEEIEARVSRDDLLLLSQINSLHTLERAGLQKLLTNRHARSPLPSKSDLVLIFETMLKDIPSRDTPALARALAERLPTALGETSETDQS